MPAYRRAAVSFSDRVSITCYLEPFYIPVGLNILSRQCLFSLLVPQRRYYFTTQQSAFQPLQFYFIFLSLAPIPFVIYNFDILDTPPF